MALKRMKKLHRMNVLSFISSLNLCMSILLAVCIFKSDANSGSFKVLYTIMDFLSINHMNAMDTAGDTPTE